MKAPQWYVVQECDVTMLNQRSKAGQKKYLQLLTAINLKLTIFGNILIRIIERHLFPKFYSYFCKTILSIWFYLHNYLTGCIGFATNLFSIKAIKPSNAPQ